MTPVTGLCGEMTVFEGSISLLCMDCIPFDTFFFFFYTVHLGKMESILNWSPCVQQVFDLYPNRRKGFDPLGFITAVLTMVGVFVPLVFREMHKSQGPALLICGTRLWGRVSYQKSFLAALELPVTFLATVIATLLMSVGLFFLFICAHAILVLSFVRKLKSIYMQGHHSWTTNSN